MASPAARARAADQEVNLAHLVRILCAFGLEVARGNGPELKVRGRVRGGGDYRCFRIACHGRLRQQVAHRRVVRRVRRRFGLTAEHGVGTAEFYSRG